MASFGNTLHVSEVWGGRDNIVSMKNENHISIDYCFFSVLQEKFTQNENLLLIYSPSGHLKCRWLNPWSFIKWKWRGSITLRVKKSRYRKHKMNTLALVNILRSYEANNEHMDCTLTSLPVIHSLNINKMFSLVCFNKYPLLPQANWQHLYFQIIFFFFFSSATALLGICRVTTMHIIQTVIKMWPAVIKIKLLLKIAVKLSGLTW